MYQFMIGMAPFTDQSVKDIFRRIQEGKIDWPDGEVSQNDENLAELDRRPENFNSDDDEVNYKLVIKHLLHCDPKQRGGIEFLRNHRFFTGKFNFDNLLEEQPPFVPEVGADDDIAYFEIRNARRGIIMSPGPMGMQNR